MRLYADENVPLAVTEALRGLGHDVLTAYDDGRANLAIPDENVLLRATELSRAVLTFNRQDFMRLHRAHPNHAGIVSCTYDPDFAGQAARVHQALQDAATLVGQLIRVNRPPANTSQRP
jgi:Domain of unknown function (DUF5615)